MSSDRQTIYSERAAPVGLGEDYINMRYDNSRLIAEFERYLSAEGRTVIKKDGQYIEQVVRFGKPLCNKSGLYNLLNILAMRSNPLMVQGNFDTDRFDEYIEMTRKEITNMIVLNRSRWGIDRSDMNAIIDNMMSFVEPFMSRILDNQERKTIYPTVQQRDVVDNKTTEDKKFRFI